MTKRRASRFADKKKKQSTHLDSLEITPFKSRTTADTPVDWEEQAESLQDRLDRVRHWLDAIEDKSSVGLDTDAIVISGADLLMLRGILDDMVDLDEDDED